ncbi:MAG: glycosyltransferase family 39 protein [Anaerolineales bacterium]
MARPYRFPLVVLILLGTFLRFYRLNDIPPGLHYDIASNALLTNSIAFDGWRPVFIGAFTGKEVLFFYWAALWFRLLGPSVFALRLAAALLGVLAIPATFFAVRAMFRHERRSGWLATLAALFLAASFMHMVWSRFGLRVIAEPVTQALALGFLFRGLHRQDRMDFVMAGLFTGLTAHTYLAARAFILPVGVGILVYLYCLSSVERRTSSVERRASNVERRTSNVGVRNLIVFAAIAFLVAAPLLAYFLANPDALLVRVSQVAPRAGEGSLLWRGISGALGMLFISGEPYDRFNIPGRPIFDPVTGALFVVGVIATIATFRRRRSAAGRPVERAAESLLLVWVPVFLLPTALAVHEVFPSNVRAFGLLPLLMVFPARGVLWLRDAVANHAKPSIGAVRRWTPLVTAMLTLAAFALVARDYFVIWARQPTQLSINDGDIAAAARFIDRVAQDDARVYMSAIHYRHPTAAFLSTRYQQIRWLTGGQALAIPAAGPALYVFPVSAPPPETWTARWMDDEYVVQLDPQGQVVFRSYMFSDAAAAALPDFEPVYANFGFFAELTGYRIVAAQAGAPLLVDLRLKVLNVPQQGDFRVVADLVDAWDFHWAQGFNDAYISEQWQPGETILVRLGVEAPAGMPPGAYHLEVTLFAPNSGENLPAIDENGRTAAAAPVGPIQMRRAGDFASAPVPQHEATASFRDVTLLGYDFTDVTLRPGELLFPTLYWRAGSATPADDYHVTMKLGAQPLASGAPVSDSYPFDQWAAGEVVIDRHAIRLPRDLSPGEYTVSVELEDTSGVVLGRVTLGTVTSEPIARDFTPPAPTHPSGVQFGDAFELRGYDVETGAGLSVTLYWRSRRETDTDYTVFVHVRDAAGALVSQHDGQPQPAERSYPTSLWLPGEYIRDTHLLDAPPGNYTVAVGLYNARTGERLTTPEGEDSFIFTNVVVP